MPKPTHEELASAHDRQDWTLLWTAAIPVVRAIVDRLRRSGDVYGVDWDDMLQEGNLAAGSAIRKWNPLEATFGTWVTACVKPRIHGIAHRHGIRESMTDHGVDVEQLPAEIVEEFDAVQVRALLGRLTDDEALVVRCVFGLDVILLSLREISSCTGWARDTVKERFDSALAKMREA